MNYKKILLAMLFVIGCGDEEGVNRLTFQMDGREQITARVLDSQCVKMELVIEPVQLTETIVVLSSSEGFFYSDANCTNSVITATIEKDLTEATVYYKNTTAIDEAVTATFEDNTISLEIDMHYWIENSWLSACELEDGEYKITNVQFEETTWSYSVSYYSDAACTTFLRGDDTATSTSNKWEAKDLVAGETGVRQMLLTSAFGTTYYYYKATETRLVLNTGDDSSTTYPTAYTETGDGVEIYTAFGS